jgi:endo-1,4-beta-D-glucanase Y
MSARHPLARRAALHLLGGSALVAAMRPAPAAAATRSDDWTAFKARFLADDGRIVDTGNRGRSHSEGQGFAMVLAVAFDDPAAFLSLWRWTRETLQVRDDALLAWAWEPDAGAVVDRNNATDGDLFVAWGLVLAARRWGEPGWRVEAARLLQDVIARCVAERGRSRLLLPGVDGFVRDDHVVVNPSYWVFPAFTAFAEAGLAGPWQELFGTGEALVDAFGATSLGLVPDWCAIGETVGPAEGFGFTFGFDAIRVPLYLRWASAAPVTVQRLRPYAAYARRYGTPGRTPAVTHLITGETSSYPVSAGGEAILRFAEHAVLATPSPDLPGWRDDLDYYAAVLLLLTQLAATDMPR